MIPHWIEITVLSASALSGGLLISGLIVYLAAWIHRQAWNVFLDTRLCAGVFRAFRRYMYATLNGRKPDDILNAAILAERNDCAKRAHDWLEERTSYGVIADRVAAEIRQQQYDPRKPRKRYPSL